MNVIKKHAKKILLALYYFIKKLAGLFWAACDYSGTGAELVKAIPAFIIAIMVCYLIWSFPIYLWLSLTYGPPTSYIIYILWIGQFLIFNAIITYMDYVWKRKG
ncbi:MAG: hypothetical protein QMD23_00110 [Candidatus Bathyarchaeia archaeon]|nr:hypothetical protein [Candidatus Bathyarchaeia archaeon]